MNTQKNISLPIQLWADFEKVCQLMGGDTESPFPVAGYVAQLAIEHWKSPTFGALLKRAETNEKDKTVSR